MSGWQEYKLGQLMALGVADLQTGPFGTMLSASEYTATGTPVIAVQDIGENKLIHKKFVYVNEAVVERLSRYKVREGDIIFGRKGAVERRARIRTNEAGWLQGSDCIRLRFDDSIDPTFISYQFGSNFYREWMIQNSTGATMPSLNQEVLKSLPIRLPSITEQKHIAYLLLSLDNKIDLLNRQNKTLEEIAEALFRQWFIEESQGSWKPVELGHLVNCFNGVSYKSDDLNPSTTAMVTLKNFDRDGGFRLDGFKDFTGKHKNSHIVTQGDLVVAHTDITQDAAVIGNPILIVADPAYEKLVISMDLVKVVSNHGWLSNEFLYRMMRTREFKQHCLEHSNGSTVLHLNKLAIPSYRFLLPPEEKIIEFTKVTKKLLGKKFENISQARTLEKIRETLLPKLMSGEIRVNY